MKTTLPSEIIELDLDQIDWTDTESVKALFQKLLNVIESLIESNYRLEAEIQKLKGEKRTPHKTSSESSGGERKRPPKSKKWRKGSKKGKVKIDRVEVVPVDKTILPPDAEFKGYRSVVKQNIKFQTDNVEYQLERYYSRSENKTYEAQLPPAYKDEFRAELKAFIVYEYHHNRVPEDKIHQMLQEVGIRISAGKISDILTKEKQEEFTMEREAILEAGLDVSSFVNTDDTGIKHKWLPHHIHVLCTSVFTYFKITQHKDRPTIRRVLRIPEGEQSDKIIVTDDAKQYWGLSKEHGLCWFHEIRHYNDLTPVLQVHQKALEEILDLIWKYYRELEAYKEKPLEVQKQKLEKRFDSIFTTPTGYETLDHRLALTTAKKDRLLVVLNHPEVPLHNNDAERPLREPVIKRQISYGTRSDAGKRAWENMLSIRDTCRKLNVSFYQYLVDMFSGNGAMTPLETLIKLRAQQA